MRHEVSDAHTARAVESGDLPVLATPWLIAWMEAATVRAAAPFMTPGRTTVGNRCARQAPSCHTGGCLGRCPRGTARRG
ncbi:thioesterase family protein [Streptomyces sp. NPDC056690]|uniref:thioesterase family protein n=1 Tax=unclassified Streptomyces TaxID=2593676 RepID=UPI00362715F9